MTSKQPIFSDGKLLTLPESSGLLGEVRGLIEQAREQVAREANSTLTMLYWKIGRRICGEVLVSDRAAYGQQIVATLSQQLVTDYGKGFAEKSFAAWFSLRKYFPMKQLSRQLSWSHFVEILPLKQPLEREFYAELCRR